jgi:hypothetical protein
MVDPLGIEAIAARRASARRTAAVLGFLAFSVFVISILKAMRLF